MTAEPASIAPKADAALDTPASRFPVAEFRHCMETRQIDKVVTLFTDDFVARPLGSDQIEFRGPRAKIMWNAVLEAGEFRYTEQFQSDDTIVILFNITFAEGIEFEAVDVLRINEDGKCYEIYAMARPYQPISLFTGRVALAFARQGGGLVNRFLTYLLVWPLELMQRVGEPFGVWLVRGAMERSLKRAAAGS